VVGGSARKQVNEEVKHVLCASEILPLGVPSRGEVGSWVQLPLALPRTVERRVFSPIGVASMRAGLGRARGEVGGGR
jgi:hypothetical protein